MTKFVNSVLAVTGAGGHLGRRTVEILLDRGATRVVALTRDPARIAHLGVRGVDVRHASFDEPSSLDTALAGVERLLIISTDALDGEGTRARQHGAAIGAAEAAGIRHVAYTSLTSPYPDATNPIADSHFWTEVRLASSGLDWSILRNNQYADYVIPGAEQAIASGTHYHAGGAGRRAYVTREDCAAAAAGALLTAEGRHIYDVSGPDALSGDDLAALFTRLSGKPIKAMDLPAPAFKAGLVQAGVPAAMAEVLARFDADTAKGYLGIVTDAVERLAGRSPQSLATLLDASQVARAA